MTSHNTGILSHQNTYHVTFTYHVTSEYLSLHKQLHVDHNYSTIQSYGTLIRLRHDTSVCIQNAVNKFSQKCVLVKRGHQ